jgi:ABC-2 type transport system permease protein
MAGIEWGWPQDGAAREPLSAGRAGAGAVCGHGRLRWHMFVNGLRSKLGAFELGARTVSFVLYAFMGLGLGADGRGCYLHWLPMKSGSFCRSCLLGGVHPLAVIPVMLASFQEQFDLGILLRFPVRFRSYYLLYVVFGLADVSTIMGALCCLGIWVGVTMARPELFAWTALGLAVFAAFNILLVRAVFAWIDRWLSQRKTREIVGALFMIFLLSLQLLNPALHQKRRPQPRTPQERPRIFAGWRPSMRPG